MSLYKSRHRKPKKKKKKNTHKAHLCSSRSLKHGGNVDHAREGDDAGLRDAAPPFCNHRQKDSIHRAHSVECVA